MYYFGAATMLGMTSVILYIVAARYLFNRPPIWSEDLPRIIFVWMVYGCGGVAVRLGLNIRVVALVRRFPERTQLIIKLVCHTLVIGFLFVLGFYSLDLIALNLGGTILSLGWSNAFFSMPLLVGAVVMLGYQVRLLILTVMALSGKLKLVENEQLGASAEVR